MKIFKIIVPIFDQQIRLVIWENRGDDKKAFDLAGGFEASQKVWYAKKDVEGFCLEDDLIIFLWKVDNLNVIVHEAQHLTMALIKRCWLPMPNYKNNELNSYFTAWIVDEVNKNVEKYKASKKS